MRRLLIVAVSLALAAPVLAQPPLGHPDWSKPVIGVDPPVQASAENRTLPTTVDLIAQPSPREMTAEEVEQYVREQGLWSSRVHRPHDSVLPVEVITFDDLKTLPPPPPPCERPVEKAPTDAPPMPTPCPDEPSR